MHTVAEVNTVATCGVYRHYVSCFAVAIHNIIMYSYSETTNIMPIIIYVYCGRSLIIIIIIVTYTLDSSAQNLISCMHKYGEGCLN